MDVDALSVRDVTKASHVPLMHHIDSSFCVFIPAFKVLSFGGPPGLINSFMDHLLGSKRDSLPAHACSFGLTVSLGHLPQHNGGRSFFITLLLASLICLLKMYRLIVLAALLHCTVSQQYQQKVAPGVPPQQYQNYQQPPPPPPPQQVHHQAQQQAYQQQQYQQVPQQMPQHQVPQHQVPQHQVPQQQVPQQQMPQQQVPQQQVPQHHPHHGDPQLLNPANIAHERDHIQEHLDVPIDTSKMTEQELQFHYFKMHDSDNNNKLDGCELIKSLIHWHEQGHKQHPPQQNAPVGEKIFQDDELVNLIDPILNMDDHNRDGFIDYPEFIRAQQKNQGQDEDEESIALEDSDIARVVDLALEQMDFNDDGFIVYEEYRHIGEIDFELLKGQSVKTGDHEDERIHTIIYKDEDLTEIVEGALGQVDRNNDGYIDYAEFKSIGP
ncbi:Multiple coagulation factor deficiency protein 2 homolog [Eumeta japonica]|uniref:Multiple coagulation factor deficiency protein 2 homolog n=1 Tax=Eumeta variegata TaxID=151549 RepID=A0A4C1VJS7_EUMVA|nr:Multiple coagulation factor deficiency protein 2 homolog [Eumeta japonica]